MKATAILVQMPRPLRYLPPHVLTALDWFLFQFVQGMSPEHQRRWKRLWRRLFHSKEAHPSLQLYAVVERSRPFHARWMAIETRIFANQDGFLQLEGFRYWLKTGAAFGTYEASAGRLVFVPSSLSWDDCSDDEMREFTEAALAFLNTPYALETLWPAVRAEQRHQMLEAAMKYPEEDQ